jgi:hypothetical protein
VAQENVTAAFALTIPPTISAVVPLVGAMFPGFSAAAGAPGWQRLTDQLFQALGRTAPSFTEPGLLARDSSQELLPFSDHPDESWDETVVALDGRRAWSLRIDQHSQRPRTADTAPSSWAIAEAPDQAVVEQAFAQTAEMAEPGTEAE